MQIKADETMPLLHACRQVARMIDLLYPSSSLATSIILQPDLTFTLFANRLQLLGCL